MKLQWLKPGIVLTAALITCIADIFHKSGIMSSMLRLLVVVIIFTVIGQIATAIIMKVIKKREKELEEMAIAENSAEETDEEQELQ